MKPQIIVGAFGYARAERIAYAHDFDSFQASAECGPVILDLKSRFVMRSLMGRLACVFLSPIRFRILLLLSAVPYLATRAEVEEQLWGECEDGGPDTFKAIDAHLYHLRRQLAPLGLVVKAEWGIGLALCDAPVVDAMAKRPSVPVPIEARS